MQAGKSKDCRLYKEEVAIDSLKVSFLLLPACSNIVRPNTYAFFFASFFFSFTTLCFLPGNG